MKTRLPRNKRAKDPPRMELTKRRRAIIRAVDKYRWLTRPLVEILYFPPEGDENSFGYPRGSRSAKHTLRLLYDHVLLGRAHQPHIMGEGSRNIVYILPTPRELWKISRKGKRLQVKHPEAVAALQEIFGQNQQELHAHLKERRYDGQRKQFEHPLAVNQARVALELGARAQGWTVSEWIDDPTLHQKGNYDRVRIPKAGGTKETPLIPDGYFVLGFGNELPPASFFLEADRETLSLSRWEERVKAYVIYYSSGAYTQRYAAESLTVLTVCPSQKRAANMRKVTERVIESTGLPALAEMFCYTTYEQATWETVFTAPIWLVAGQPEPQVLINTPKPPSTAPSDGPSAANSWYDILQQAT